VLMTSKGPLWFLPGWILLLFITLVTLSFGGESVFYAETRRIAGFDPAKAMDLPSIQAQSKMYEGLVQYAYLDRPYRVEPCLAEALPTISPDGTLYTFKIRKGIYFQDDPCFAQNPAGKGKGRELCATDFVYGIKRVADLKVGSPGYWAFRDRIVGLDDFRNRSGNGPTDYDARCQGWRPRIVILCEFTWCVPSRPCYGF